MLDSLKRRVAAAIGSPAGLAGSRRGPSWGRRHAAYAPNQETLGEWSARAVMATLDDAGVLIPTDGKPAAYRPGGDGRPIRAVIALEGPHDIFRFMVNMLGWQCEFGSAARGVLVDMRDHLGFEQFDSMARALLGGSYEKLAGRFLRDYDCDNCGKTIRVGGRYWPTREAGAVCVGCCRGFPEYMAQLVKRQPEPVKVTVDA